MNDFPCIHDFMFVEIYMKFVDDSGDHIDLFSEIDRNHATEKMKIDEGKMCAKFIFISRVKHKRMQQVRSWTWIPCAFLTSVW